MPKLVNTDDDDSKMQTYQIGGSKFTFKAARIGDLSATEYTLVSILVDTTGSTEGFTDQLREMLITAVDSCKKSPRREFLLIRVLTFSKAYKNGHMELHGFKPVLDINTDSYPTFVAGGGTPLWDATFAGVGALADYGAELANNDFNANGILFVITDGAESGASTATPKMIANKLAEITRSELLESLASILIGINASQYASELKAFRKDAGFTQYIDAGDVTRELLAKLAAFVSESVSSQSQAIGTGESSQNIAATI